MMPFRRLAVLACAVTLAACESPVGWGSGAAATSDTTITVSRIENFQAGQTAKLVGTNLDQITSLTMDGVEVSLSGTGATERTFTAPSLRACESDRRIVSLRVNGSASPIGTRVRLARTDSLKVGESVVLDLAALPDCLQLPGSDQDYVVTALNLGEDTVNRADPLVRLTAWGNAPGGATPVSSANLSLSRSREEEESIHMGALLSVSNPTAPYSASPEPFDPRYATAEVGDVVRFVDWDAPGNICSLSRSDVPTYDVEILAVAGKTVIGVDTRLHNLAGFRAAKAAYQRAAEIADPLILPTMRRVFDPVFELPPSAGGRHYHVVHRTVSGSAASARSGDGGTASATRWCPAASEMIASLFSSTYTLENDPWAIRYFAGTIIHEYAHNADHLTAWRLAGGNFSLYGAGGWLTEALAVLAEGTAIRIASGQSMNASPVPASVSTPLSAHLEAYWGGSRNRSLWANGGYGPIANLLTYAAEKLGIADLGSSGPSLYERVARYNLDRGSRKWGFDALLALTGQSRRDFLDQSSIAFATEGLIDREAARAASLPQLETWDAGSANVGGYISQSGRQVPREQNTTRTLAAASGNFTAAYLFASPNQEGISLDFDAVSGANTIVRITRLR